MEIWRCLISGWKVIYQFLQSAYYVTKIVDQYCGYKTGVAYGAEVLAIPLVDQKLKSDVL